MTKSESIIMAVAFVLTIVAWAILVLKVAYSDSKETFKDQMTTSITTNAVPEETTEADSLSEAESETETKPCEDEEYEEYQTDENAYRRMIVFPEYEMAPIEVSLDEDLELGAETDDGFVVFKKYVDRDGIECTFRFSEKSQRIVYDCAKKYDLPYRIVLAVLGVETDWNENRNHRETNDGTRYIGIGCINEKYHAENLAKRGIDIYTLEGNIEGVCYLLRQFYDRFGNLTYAIMAYNGGGNYAHGKRENGVTETSYTKLTKKIAESFE